MDLSKLRLNGFLFLGFIISAVSRFPLMELVFVDLFQKVETFKFTVGNGSQTS